MDGFLLVSRPPIAAGPGHGKEHIKKSAYDYPAGRLGFGRPKFHLKDQN
jgi:hypothetical protein